MFSGKEKAAAARSLWLSELSRAIDEAQRLAWRMGVVEGPHQQALDLYVQLETARAEVERLRGRKSAHPAGPGHDLPFPDRGAGKADKAS